MVLGGGKELRQAYLVLHTPIDSSKGIDWTIGRINFPTGVETVLGSVSTTASDPALATAADTFFRTSRVQTVNCVRCRSAPRYRFIASLLALWSRRALRRSPLSHPRSLRPYGDASAPPQKLHLLFMPSPVLSLSFCVCLFLEPRPDERAIRHSAYPCYCRESLKPTRNLTNC